MSADRPSTHAAAAPPTHAPALPVPAIRRANAGRSHFFGFHDLTPWDAASGRLVCLRTGVEESRLPEADDVAEVCLVTPGGDAVEPIGETRAWNWQQAARQQWVPGEDGAGSTVVYNVATRDAFGACLHDPESGLDRALAAPVHDVSSDGRFALGLDCARLSALYRSYGYGHAQGAEILPADAAGISRVDLRTGAATTLVSLAEVADHAGVGLEQPQFLTHVSIAPDDRAFCFLHRVITASGGVVTRLYWSRTDRSAWRVLADDRVSHFGWWGPERLVAWTRENRTIRTLKSGGVARWIRPVARPLFQLSRRLRGSWVRQHLYGEEFRAYHTGTGRSQAFARGVIEHDGHPQANPRRNDVWVNDTYPDAGGDQTLMLYHARSRERLDLARLATGDGIRETGWRCDLHPRWDPAGERLCVDSAHAGRRQLYVFDVRGEVRRLEERAGDGHA